MIEFIRTKKTTETPLSHCTRCFRRLDAASHCTKDVRPHEGDPGICLYCGHLMVFDKNLIERDPTPQELLYLKRSEVWPQIQEMQAKFRNATMALAIKPRKPE